MPLNRDVLAYALKHLENDRIRIEALITRVRATLGSTPAPASAVPDPSMPDWVLSSSEKEVRAEGERPAAKKRTISAKGQASIAAAQKKRWEAIRKTKEAKVESKPVLNRKRGKKAKS